MEFFRKPAHADATGDAIPFFHNGKYHIYSLTPPPGTGTYPERLRTTWHHVSSSNLLSWEDQGQALAPGGEGTPDADGCWTGSVVFGEGQFHAFYTGYSIQAEYPQTICHATSPDGVAWTKDPLNPIIVPRTDLYERLDWRDPFAFYNDEDGCYWLILSARKNSGPLGRRGCIVLYRSSDLASWTYHGPIYEPWHTNCPECPELYRIGATWYLCYSRFSEFGGTIYRISRSPFGGWRTPKYDQIGTRRFYAAKSMADDRGRRFYFGWTPDRARASDRGEWYWGGVFAVPHEVTSSTSALLEVRLPAMLHEVFSKPVRWEYLPITGAGVGADGIELHATGSMACGFLSFAERQFLFSCNVTVEDCHGQFGLVLKASKDLGRCLMLCIEPATGRVSLVAYPCPVDPFWEASVASMGQTTLPGPDGPRVAEAFIDLLPGVPLTLNVLVDGSLIEACVGDRVVLNYRWYDAADHELGVMVEDGNARFSSISIKVAD